jgi:hypothetical protein
MKLIPVSGQVGAGKLLKVDDDVNGWANSLSWSLTKDGYAHAWHPKKKKHVYLHREILMDKRFTKHKYVDHINGDTLDYRRENLRPCTMSQNQMNARKRKNTRSRYKGVRWNSQFQHWRVFVKKDGQDHFIGSFQNERHAALAYDLNAPYLFGPFFKGNFTSDETAGKS